MSRNAHGQGIGLFNTGQFEAAIVAFQEAVEGAQKGTLDEQLSCFYLAESYSALALSPVSGEEIASPLLGGMREQTVQTLRDAVALNPGYADLHYHLSRALLGQDLLVEALNAADRALALNPKFARATLLRGCVLFAQGRQEEGIREAVRAVVRERFLSRSAIRVAISAYSAGDYPAALRLLRHAVSEEIGEPDEMITQVYTLGREGRYHEAIDTYRRVLNKYPDYADLRNGFGMALHAIEEYADAAREFERATRLNPHYVAAYLNRGLSLEKLGRVADARDAYRRVIALEPEHSVARVRLAALNTATESVATDQGTEEATTR